ncbi:hypothetical protein HanIR_Chr06g0271911 [Helianthus annuus]|nr:hypothetical protein HanIR_Chr06g0271911 [Helianthus annuus]
MGVFVFFFFCEKLFNTSYVCPTQTARRCLSLQCVCFLEDLSLKKVCETSSWGRCELSPSSLFSSPLPFQNTNPQP